jgi:hypothetical protein
MMVTTAMLKTKMMCGTCGMENETVTMVEVVVMAQFVVLSSRARHAMIRVTSPR